MASVGLPAILRAKAASATLGKPKKDTAVILLWLDGGPGHMDLYDMKPEAPAEYRGIWRPIPTNVPAFEISELLPLQARVADKFSIVRSIHHRSNGHFDAAHVMLTSRSGARRGIGDGKYPSIGAITAKVCGPRRRGLPPFVSVPIASSVNLRPGYFGASYLGLRHNPFETGGNPNSADFQVDNLGMPSGLTIERLTNRRGLLEHFDRLRREVDASRTLDAMDGFERDAYELVTSSAARKAFEIDAEDPRLRDRYGRNDWGQSTLLARRLVEGGSTFVTVHYGGWDHHWGLQGGMERHLPRIDRAVSALFQDLEDRGQLSRVLVVLCGEFGRTPKMNDGGNGGPPLSQGTPGRDHWAQCMFCLLGGGGVKGGQIVGATTSRGEAPKERPLTPGDIHAMIYHVLGVDPQLSFLNHAGRPIPAIDHGDVIPELL